MENIFELNLPKTFAVDPNEVDDNQSKPKDGSSNLDPDTEVETDADLDEEDKVVTKTKESFTPKEEETEEDSSDDNGTSIIAELAKLEVKSGLFEGLEEEDIPEDLTPEQLSSLYRKSLEIKTESLRSEIIKDVTASVEHHAKYVEYLVNGGSPEAVQEAIGFNKLIELSVYDEDNQRTLLTALMEYKQVPKEDIQDIVDGIIDKGKGEQRAAQAKEDFKKIEDSILENHKKEQDRQRDAQRRTIEEYTNSIKKVVATGEVSGVKISKTDQDKILTAMFTPSEVVEYTNDAGKKEKTRVTKLQVLQAELQNDPAKQVAYALWLLNGSDFSFAKKQGKEEEQNTLRDLLNSRNTSKTGKTNTTSKSKYNKFISDLGGQV